VSLIGRTELWLAVAAFLTTLAAMLRHLWVTIVRPERKTDSEIHVPESRDIRFSDFSNDELLEELARRLRSASEELERLRVVQDALSEKDVIGTLGRHLRVRVMTAPAGTSRTLTFPQS
jgi:hypothetical protein